MTDIVTSLATRVRALTLDLAADLACDGNRKAAQCRLTRFVRRGKLCTASNFPCQRYTSEVMCYWRPGDPEPSFHSLEYQSRRRAESVPVQAVRIWWASAETSALFGVSGSNEYQYAQTLTHDLVLAAHFVRLSEDEQHRWRGEDVIAGQPKFATYKPDAVLVDDRGRIARAVESGGSYSWRRYARIHQWCKSESVQYEVV